MGAASKELFVCTGSYALLSQITQKPINPTNRHTRQSASPLHRKQHEVLQSAFGKERYPVEPAPHPHLPPPPPPPNTPHTAVLVLWRIIQPIWSVSELASITDVTDSVCELRRVPGGSVPDRYHFYQLL